MPQNQRYFMVAGGGTGGHIYPAIAIAQAIQKENDHLIPVFVGATDGLERSLAPKAIDICHFLPVGKVNRVSRWVQLVTLLKLPWAVLRMLVLIAHYRPAWVVGVGGYASVVPVWVASLIKIPTAVWEPNAVLGMANRFLMRRVDLIFAVHAEALKSTLKGTPLEHRVATAGVPLAAHWEAPLQPASQRTGHGSKLRILVFGGSQGARPLSSVIADWIERQLHPELFELVLQTGAQDFSEFRQRLQKYSWVEVHDFLYDMPERYAWADLVVCRAGSGSLTELAATGSAALLVPLPTAADNHQWHNAKVYERLQAAIVVEQIHWNAKIFDDLIVSLRKNPEQLARLRTNVRQFFQPQAARGIARELISKYAD